MRHKQLFVTHVAARTFVCVKVNRNKHKNNEIMSAPENQTKIKYADAAPKLDKSQLEFMKLIESQNLERVLKLKRVRRNNLITAGVLGASVLGVYAYSMLSVQQERFLDDFEEPKKVSSN